MGLTRREIMRLPAAAAAVPSPRPEPIPSGRLPSEARSFVGVVSSPAQNPNPTQPFAVTAAESRVISAAPLWKDYHPGGITFASFEQFENWRDRHGD